MELTARARRPDGSCRVGSGPRGISLPPADDGPMCCRWVRGRSPAPRRPESNFLFVFFFFFVLFSFFLFFFFFFFFFSVLFSFFFFVGLKPHPAAVWHSGARGSPLGTAGAGHCASLQPRTCDRLRPGSDSDRRHCGGGQEPGAFTWAAWTSGRLLREFAGWAGLRRPDSRRLTRPARWWGHVDARRGAPPTGLWPHQAASPSPPSGEGRGWATTLHAGPTPYGPTSALTIWAHRLHKSLHVQRGGDQPPVPLGGG